MISYDVIGDYMSDLDDVRKRIEKRKRPLNDHNFKKLYNGMVRLMVMMIVVLGSLIVLKNPELEHEQLLHIHIIVMESFYVAI